MFSIVDLLAELLFLIGVIISHCLHLKVANKTYKKSKSQGEEALFLGSGGTPESLRAAVMGRTAPCSVLQGPLAPLLVRGRPQIQSSPSRLPGS